MSGGEAEMHARATVIFLEARELSPGLRAAFVERACAGDGDLRSRVTALLAAIDEPTAFLSSPTAARGGGDAPTLDTPSRGHAAEDSSEDEAHVERPGSRIGPYKLLQQIGEGGFGSVFMAEQEKPVARKVALKVIKLGMDTRQVVARFEQERQALALMDHPNIAKVFDAGATESGRPYFVMELCTGQPISDYCDRNRLNVQERLELFAQVCSAVQHAHQKGLIHRDIKPSNILVATQDGRPHAKVIDFGIAKATASKLTEKTLFTEHRQLIGTPEYMSPEQAEGSLDIDTRTDVYALGVLLYELLTGTTPFTSKQLRSGAYAEIQRIIREEDPPKPSTRLSQATDTLAGVAAARQTEPRKLGTLIRGELDWIVMKALEKDRARRYDSATAFGEEIRRYLNGEAVVAAPPGAAYRLRKFVRRHKGKVAAGLAVSLALVLGIAGTTAGLISATRQRAIAEEARASEAQQRRLAEQSAKSATEQAERALAAEAETKKRAEELAQVAGFQAEMLQQIDATAAGERLMTDVRERLSAALSRDAVPEDQRRSRTESFAKELAEVNATDTAVELINQTILRPAITAIDSQFKDQPTVDASLRHTLAELYRILGKLDDAALLQEHALATRRRILGEEHPDTSMSLNNLAIILENQGKIPGAEAYYREALEKRRRVRGEDHPETLVTMSNLGNLLREQGKFADAETLLRASLEGHRRVVGPENRDTLIAMNSYGYLLIEQGKAKDAEPYWREAYEIGTRVFGADDRDVLVWTNNMGGLLGTLGRHAEAEPFYRKALEGARRVHGLEHPSTMYCLMSYAGVLQALGRGAEAVPYYREALDTRRRTLGDDHPETLLSMANLGNALREQGQVREAEPLLREALERRRRLLGNDHPSTIIGMGQLAKICSDKGSYDEAESLYREALDISLRVWGEENPNRLVFLNNLGVLYIQLERYEDAEPLVRKSLEARRRISGASHPETLVSMTGVARVLEARKQYDEAEALYREALTGFRKALGDNHGNTMNAVTNLAGVLRVQEKFDESEALWREAVAGFERLSGKDNARTANARLGLGRALLAQKRFGEGEPELVEAERVLATASGVAPGRHDRCVEVLVEFYEAWDKAEPGKGYGAKAEAWKQKVPAKPNP